MRIINISKDEVFDYLSLKKEVYMFDPKREELKNLYRLTPWDIHSYIESNEQYMYFIIKEV